MNGYVPIFEQVVDSSLWEEPLHVRVMFLTLLAIKDMDHIARVQDHHLKRIANLESDELVLDALRILESPDKRSSITQPEYGRRIDRVKGGWFIINGEKYQDMMREANKKAAAARRQREFRARQAASKIIRSVAPLPSVDANGIL